MEKVMDFKEAKRLQTLSFYIGESLFTLFASLTYADHHLVALIT